MVVLGLEPLLSDLTLSDSFCAPDGARPPTYTLDPFHGSSPIEGGGLGRGNMSPALKSESQKADSLVDGASKPVSTGTQNLNRTPVGLSRGSHDNDVSVGERSSATGMKRSWA